MARVKRSVLVERQMKMLLYLKDEAVGCGKPFAQLSLREMSHALALSESQVRFCLRALADADLLRIEPRILPNGGTAENAYRITPKGAALLAAHRKAAAAARS